jgi:hypothetical protein
VRRTAPALAVGALAAALAIIGASGAAASDHPWQWSSKVDPFKTRPDILLWLTNDERQTLRMWCGPMSDGEYGGYLSVHFPHRVCVQDGAVAVRARLGSEIVSLEGHCYEGAAVALMGDEGSRLFDLAGSLSTWAFEVIADGRRHVAQFSASSTSESRIAGLSAVRACAAEQLKDAEARKARRGAN